MALHEITVRIRLDAEHTAPVADDVTAAVRAALPAGAKVAVLRHREALSTDELTPEEVEAWFAEEVVYPPEDRYLDALLDEGPVVEVPLPPTARDRLAAIAMAIGVSPEAILRRAAVEVVAFESALRQTGLPGLEHWTADEVRPDAPFGEQPTGEMLRVDLGDAYDDFLQVAVRMRRTPAQGLARVVAAVTEIDDGTLATMQGFDAFSAGDSTQAIVERAVSALTGRIRDVGFKWPTEKPFPWNDTDCAAAVRGYGVRWPGEFDDFQERLRGLWEMSDGYAFLRQS